jgi:hypothetical protein
MTAFLWFLLGLWVGCSAGFLLFACSQVARDGERATGTIPGLERRVSLHDRRMQTDLFALNAHRRRAKPARNDYLRPGWVEAHPQIARALGVARRARTLR